MYDLVKVWRKLKSEVVCDCKVFKVLKNRFHHPDGRESDFFEISSLNWVQVAAIVDENKVVMVKQFRFGVEKKSWEFSGGVIEKDEAPKVAALRELQEETGYTGDVEIVASFSPNPAIQSNTAFFAIAKNCKKVSDVNWDENEEIETKLVEISELDAMVKRGEIFHSIAINGVYYLQKYLENRI